jgi:hypothetical protein
MGSGIDTAAITETGRGKHRGVHAGTLREESEKRQGYRRIKPKITKRFDKVNAFSYFRRRLTERPMSRF